MTTLSGRARYRRIIRFAARQLVQEWWFELVLPRLGLGALGRRGRSRRQRAIARRFHVLAVELGGLLIKVGQFMSSRLDVLPPEITSELEGLQDEVPAVPFAELRALAEAELGVSLDAAFASFDPVPIAAASLGQAHRARLSPAEAGDAGFADVVVKVQRPGIDEIVEIDLAALRRVARWLARVRLISSRIDAPELVEEFAATSLEEIDYLHEAASLERFAENFADDPRARAPEVAWERTTRRVLTMSDVTAIKITDVDALRAAGVDPDEVAQTLAGVMFDQLIVDGFFHADPHPGNIFVTPVQRVEERPQGASRNPAPQTATPFVLSFVDFGMMGEVPETLRQGLRELVTAVATRDAAGLVHSFQTVGTLLPSADTTQLEDAMRALFDRFGGMGFSELRRVDPREFRAFGEEFGDVMRTMPFQLPENFLLVVRAVSVTSGVCTSLSPEFNVWEAIEPFTDDLLREGRGAVRDLGKRALDTVALAARLPARVDEVITRLERGRLAVASPAVERRLRSLERMLVRVVWAIVFAGLLVAGAVLVPAHPPWGWTLMGVSVLPLLIALAPRRRE